MTTTTDVFTCRDVHYHVTVRGSDVRVSVGETITRDDEQFIVLQVTRGPEYNGTGKVLVRWVKHHVPAWIGHENDYYDHALGLRVVAVMTPEQETALRALCERYKVPFDPSDYTPQFDLPTGYVGGWIGGDAHRKLNVGCDPDGVISS